VVEANRPAAVIAYLAGSRNSGVTTVVNARTGQVVLRELREAQGPWGKFVGLMFAPSLDAAHGLLFRPAKGMHTHFMRFPIDLIYLDDAGNVESIREAMVPWRFDFRSAAAVIEVNAGVARSGDIQVGDRLRLEDTQLA
jgi:uncharacterized membrane protein (UPF0127 family)